MKLKKWKRILSLILAIVLVAPTVLSLVPELSVTVNAVDLVDVGGMSASYAGNGLLVNGVYEIWLPDTGLVWQGSSDGTKVFLGVGGEYSTWQSWVIEYGGEVQVRGSTSHWYTMYNLASGRTINQSGDSLLWDSATAVGDDYFKWRLLYDGDTGLYSIQCLGQHNNGSTADWNGYAAPVTAVYGANLQGAWEPYGWEIRAVPVQKYASSYRLEQGTYRVTNGSNYWTAITTSANEPVGESGLGVSTTKKTDGTQLYQLDWTSAGYVTVFDTNTGRYIGDRNTMTTAYDGSIAELYDSPTNSFDDRLRFYWRLVPVLSNGSRTGEYYLCNLLTGRCLEVAGSVVLTNKITKTPWTFTKLTATQIADESTTQGYNGAAGVYLDSLDMTDTIKLPITIYDYVNDGMLFEYAESNGKGTQTINGLDYIMGNNKAFTFQSGSTGGYWDPSGAGYLDNIGKIDNDDPSSTAWNAYNTCLTGRVWYKFNNSSGWYSVGGQPVASSSGAMDWHWEVDGLGDFRNVGNSYKSDEASIYWMYAYNQDTYQGLSSKYPTLNAAGKELQSFTAPLWSGDTVVNTDGSLSHTGYSYYLYGQVKGMITLGLVQPKLNEFTNAPEYRDVTVEYLAKLLSQTLAIDGDNVRGIDLDGDGVMDQYAYNYVDGADHTRYGTVDGAAYRGLDDWLRSRILRANAGAIGSYAETYAKRDKLIGAWADCAPYIQTYCDAAYYMLNNLFVANSYNDEQDMFDYLELTSVKMDDADGNIVDAYVFDSGFTTKGTGTNSKSAVYYDTQDRVIRNSNVTGKAHAFYDENGSYAAAHPFLPVWETFDMDTQTGTQADTESPYLQDDGVTNTTEDVPDTYEDRNYNYVLVSNGEFKYSYADELFFNFQGDDDVYLFINGQLVLDIGGAHAISEFKINLNDYVDEARKAVANGTATERDHALALQDGEIYSFDFYYMERHGWGSNMRIATNIRVVERGMLVEKDGAQLEADLTTNDIVLAGEPIEYDFTLTNTGTTDLIWPTFTDDSIGVTISYDNGLTVTDNGVEVFDKNGGALEASDLILTYTNAITGVSYTRTFSDNEELIGFLTDRLIIESGDKPDTACGQVMIRGIYYKLSREQINAGVFRNEVDVSAYIRNGDASSVSSNVSRGDAVTGTVTTTDPVKNDFTVENPLDNTVDYILPSFSDPDRGVTIDPQNGLVVSGDSPAVDGDGGTLDVTDLVIRYQRPDGTTVTRTFGTDQELTEYLKELVIGPGGSLQVEGIYYERTTDEVKDGFTNEVTTQVYAKDPEQSGNVPEGDAVTGSCTTTEAGVTTGDLVQNDLVVENPMDNTVDYVFPTLSDPDKGVTVDHLGGLTVSGSNVVDKDGGTLEVSDLTIKYVHPDGTTDVRTFTDNEELTRYLHDELVIEPGGKLIVEGIYYEPTTQDLEGGLQNQVDTQVYERDPDASTTPTNSRNSEDALKGKADFTVYVPTRPLYYHWKGHTLTVSASVLLEDIKKAVADPDDPLSTLVETTITGFNSVTVSDHQLPTLLPGEFSVTTAGDITACFQSTGVKRIYLEVDYNYSVSNGTQRTTATIPVQIFVVDVRDEMYVLDYGLHVELSFDELFGEDVLVVPDRDTAVEILGIASEAQTPSYGSNSVNGFYALDGWQIPSGGTYDGELTVTKDATGEETVLKYVPREFMEGRDKLHIALRVRETDYTGAAVLGQTGSTSIQNEAVMFKTITILPANVVYYEDDFPAVTVYNGSFERTSQHGKAQSADQSLQYGYDPVYAGCEDVTMSGGILTTIPITPPAEGQTAAAIQAAQFTFSGKGFEIVSRTDAKFATAIQVDVYQIVDGERVLKKRLPVITEFDNHDADDDLEVVYQVPVIRVDMESHGTYAVEIYGIPTVKEVRMDDAGGMTAVYGDTTHIYIDGIRIYDPLDDATQEEYGQEWKASFDELRTLVFDGKAAVMGITTDETANTVLVGATGTHSSFTENRNEGWFQDSEGDLEQSILAGPNNEVYLTSGSQSYAVLFYVTGEGKLDVGLHDMHETLFTGQNVTANGSSSVSYWLSSGVWSQPIQVEKSGTEQYYPVDYTQCPRVVQGGKTYYQVLIRVDSGMVSFTNVKSVGLTFADIFAEDRTIRYSYVDGILTQEALKGHDEAGNEIWEPVEMPRTTTYLYKTEGGKLYYAQRYDAQGNEIPAEQLQWQTDAPLLCWYYRTKDGELQRAAQYDGQGNVIAPDQLQWEPVGNSITYASFHVREALTTAAVEQEDADQPQQDPVETPQTPTQTPQETPAPTGWLSRFLMWIREMLRRVLG